MKQTWFRTDQKYKTVNYEKVSDNKTRFDHDEISRNIADASWFEANLPTTTIHYSV